MARSTLSEVCCLPLEIVCVSHHTSRPCGPSPKSFPDAASQEKGARQARWGRFFSGDEYRCRLLRRWQQLASSFRPRKVTVYTREEVKTQDETPVGQTNERTTQKPTHTDVADQGRPSLPPGRTGCPGAARTWVGKSWWNTVAGWEISLCYLRKSRQAGKVPSRPGGVG